MAKQFNKQEEDKVIISQSTLGRQPSSPLPPSPFFLKSSNREEFNANYSLYLPTSYQPPGTDENK